MTDHVHTWVPVEGVRARYRCACGAWGVRQGAGSRFSRAGGPVVAMKRAPVFTGESEVTAQPAELGDSVVDASTIKVRIADGRRTRRAPGAR